jgi:hypothetical protein
MDIATAISRTSADPADTSEESRSSSRIEFLFPRPPEVRAAKFFLFDLIRSLEGNPLVAC